MFVATYSIRMRPSRCGLGCSTGRTNRYQPLHGVAFGSGKFVVPTKNNGFPEAFPDVFNNFVELPVPRTVSTTYNGNFVGCIQKEINS